MPNYYSGSGYSGGLLQLQSKLKSVGEGKKDYDHPSGWMELLMKELGDPQSQYYKTFQSNLRDTLNQTTPTVNSLLAARVAMGLNPKSAGNIAKEQREAIEGRNRDFAGKATKNLFLSALGTRVGLMGQLSRNEQFYDQLGLQQRQLNAQIEAQPSFLEQMGSGLLNMGSFGLGSWLGGGGGFGGSSSGRALTYNSPARRFGAQQPLYEGQTYVPGGN